MAEIRVPTLGESVTEATVATWFKNPGDTVSVDEMLCELETDKVTVEVPSSVKGVLSKIVAKEGDTVGLDSVLATISEGEIQSSKPLVTVKETSVETQESKDKPTIRNDIEHATSAKKLMKENVIDPASISGPTLKTISKYKKN